MEGYGDAVTDLKGICTTIADLNARLEDRNRTAPVPFQRESFEFRAVRIGLAVLDTAVAEGLPKLSSMIEGGKSPRGGVAALLSEVGIGHSLHLFNWRIQLRGCRTFNTPSLMRARGVDLCRPCLLVSLAQFPRH